MANHLEKLIRQYYEWKEYIVKSNVKVGRLPHGGWAGELDVVVYKPDSQEVIHYEPSLDGNSWPDREEKYQEKFKPGREHIKDVFPWLPPNFQLRQVAIFNNVPPRRRHFVGAEAIGIDDFVKEIKDEITKCGYIGENAIPEQYDLLRTIPK